MNTPAKASLPVIKRLPKYYRYLRSLQVDGINSISSRELAAQMGTTCLLYTSTSAASARRAERCTARRPAAGTNRGIRSSRWVIFSALTTF